jgi:hypothetical protein
VDRRAQYIGSAAAILCVAAGLVPTAEARLTALAPARYDSNGVYASPLAVDSGHALVARPGSRGTVRVLALSLAGGRPRRLLTLTPPRGRTTEIAEISASRGQVGILSNEHLEDGADPYATMTHLGSLTGAFRRLTYSTWDGRRDLPVRLRPTAGGYVAGWLHPKPPRYFLTVTTDADTRQLEKAFDMGVAGDLFAYVESGSNGRLLVTDLRTGAERYRVQLPDLPEAFDLAPDGRAVAWIDHRVLLIDPPGIVRKVPFRRGVELTEPRLAGDRLVAVNSRGLNWAQVVEVSPRDGRVRPLGPVADHVDAIEAEGRTVAWHASGCTLTTDVTARAGRNLPPGPCARSIVQVPAEQETRLRGRTVRVRVRCLHSDTATCRGRASISSSSGGAHARKRFRIPRGKTRRLTFRLSVQGIRRLRRAIRIDNLGSAVAETRDRAGRRFVTEESLVLHGPRRR